jgi:hypothetical protein
MNLFARILSHGFALVLVALLAIGLVYRGDLFPGLKLPEFLTQDSGQEQDESKPPAADEKMQSAGTTSEPTGEESTVTPAPVNRDEDSAISGSAMPASSGVAGIADEQTDSGVSASNALSPEPAAVAQEPPGEAAAGSEYPADAEEQRAAPTLAEPLVPAEPAAAESEPMPEQAYEPAPEQAYEPAPERADGVTDLSPPADQEGEAAATPPSTDLQGEVVAPPEAGADTASESAAPGVAPASEPAATGQVGKVSTYQILAAAREAFWLRDYVVAEQYYNELISLDPANPDGYGELGNMYFSQGEWEKASAAYYEAGVRLLSEGMVSEAQQLVEVIRGLNGTQADDLEKEISQAASTAQ